MAFFDLPPDEEISPETRATLEEYRRLAGAETVAPTWKVFARNPPLIEARFKAFRAMSYDSSFGWDARCIATMLIAHARRCKGCFAGARNQLDQLGFDEPTMDAMCAAPETLPLEGRDRLFVHYALKVATSAADLQPKDFKEMAAQGLSQSDVQEIIAFAAYWSANTVFTSATLAALFEDDS